MDEKSLFFVKYTARSHKDADTIKAYLLYKFTQREVDNFYGLLTSFEEAVIAFPESFPIAVPGKNIRRAVLGKQLSVFYRIRNKRISIVAILDNRMNPAK